MTRANSVIRFCCSRRRTFITASRNVQRVSDAGPREKDPGGWGPAGVLVHEQLGAPLAGSQKRPVMHDLDPSIFLKLYEIAHPELTVDKSNNSAARFPAHIRFKSKF